MDPMLFSWVSKVSVPTFEHFADSLFPGWRFSPTIITVFYAQLVGMVFYDIVKTEPFARMAQGDGALAERSVLQAPKPWWSMLVEGFRMKSNGGKLNFLLISASLVSMLSALVISPLSSSILIALTNNQGYSTDFTRISLDAQSSPSMASTPLTFFSTTGQLFNNLSSSPWSMGKYTVLPFWPMDMVARPSFDSSDSAVASANWSAPSTVLSVEYKCAKLQVQTRMSKVPFTAPAAFYTPKDGYVGGFNLNGTAAMVTTLIKSEDNLCSYRIDELKPGVSLGRESELTSASS